MQNVTTTGSPENARACNKNSATSRGFANVHSMLAWCCNAVTVDFSRFARFEAELVARHGSPPLRTAEVSDAG